MRCVLVVLVLLVALPALAAIDYLGTTTRWGWEQPTGSPDGWKVYVSRNGGEFTEEAQVTAQEVTIIGVDGETIQVKVTATLGEYETEMSEAGELVTLRVIDKPSGVAIKCDAALVEIAPGWWSCQ